jgi:hypothetical protein
MDAAFDHTFVTRLSQISTKSDDQHAVRLLSHEFFPATVTSSFCLSMPTKWPAPFAFFTATPRKSEPVTLQSGSTNIPPPPWREVMSINSGFMENDIGKICLDNT